MDELHVSCSSAELPASWSVSRTATSFYAPNGVRKMSFLFCPFCGAKCLDYIKGAFPLASCQACNARCNLQSLGVQPPPPLHEGLHDEKCNCLLCNMIDRHIVAKGKAVKA